jgi:hypothetical protein
MLMGMDGNMHQTVSEETTDRHAETMSQRSKARMQLSRILDEVDKYYAPASVLYFMTPKPLTRNLVTEFFLDHDRYCCSDKECKPDVVLVVDSRGGDVHAAYLLAKLIRQHCKRLTVVVPRQAKSAATLLCLAADEIVMSAIGELGPLDPLARRPGETTYRPVLDEYSALTAVHNDALSILDITIPLIAGRTGMDFRDLLTVLPSFVAELLAPVYARIDPHAHGSNMRMLNISKSYARKVFIEWGKMTEEQALEAADKIVMSYPCHDYIVDAHELQRLGLRAREATGEEEWLLHPFIRLSEKVTIIGRPGIDSARDVDSEAPVAAAAEDDMACGLVSGMADRYGDDLS